MRGDVADDLYLRASTLAAELGLSSTQRWARFFKARVAYLRGDLDAAERDVRAIAPDGAAAGDGAIVITTNRLLGETLLQAGRLHEADAALATALEGSVRTGDRWSRTELLAGRALIRIQQGDPAAAHSMIAESKATLRRDDIAAVGVIDEVERYLELAERRSGEAEACSVTRTRWAEPPSTTGGGMCSIWRSSSPRPAGSAKRRR